MGKIDNIIDPEIITPDVDYICFTDELRHKSDIWKFVKVDNEFENLRYKAREIKLNPHKYLDGYDYSLWVDGNIRILKNLNSFFEDLINEKVSIATFKHFSRNCVYEEALECIATKKDNKSNIYKQIALCISDNYPIKNGLAETNVVYRYHKKLEIITAMEDWWLCVRDNSIRDQLSFDYTMFKNNINYSLIKGNSRTGCEYFMCVEHKEDSFKNSLRKIYSKFIKR